MSSQNTDLVARGSANGTEHAGSDHLLRIRDLRVSYGGAVRALDNVSLDVDEGSVVAVLGNNGAGKSTLLKSISGTLSMQGGSIVAGTISFMGKTLIGLDPASVVRAGVVQVPEGRRIFGDLTVEENLRVAAMAGHDRAERAVARDRVFGLFPRLNERRAQRGSLLSGGEQQMLAIGRALMTTPKLLLLDEPSLGLAPNLVAQIARVIREINEQGTTVLLVEQDAAMALELADQAYVLEVGEIGLEGPASELADSPDIRDRYLGGMTQRGSPAPASHAAEASRKPAALRVDNLSVYFGGINALSGVSFVVQPGATHAVIGPNGAGKSTLINVLSGVYRADQGSVFYGERELTRLRPDQIGGAGISRTFQNIALSADATVRDNLMLGRHGLTRAGFLSGGFRMPWAVREQRSQLSRIEEIAVLVGLDEHLETRAGSLPYGFQKRVELGRAISAEPSLLLLDEPVAGMNAAEAANMAQILRQVQESLGISIVIVEHNMPFVMDLADRITVLDFGVCIADGTPFEVRRDPEVIRAYLGGGESGAMRGALERENQGP